MPERTPARILADLRTAAEHVLELETELHKVTRHTRASLIRRPVLAMLRRELDLGTRRAEQVESNDLPPLTAGDTMPAVDMPAGEPWPTPDAR